LFKVFFLVLQIFKIPLQVPVHNLLILPKLCSLCPCFLFAANTSICQISVYAQMAKVSNVSWIKLNQVPKL
jgi:hypothetical protein